MIVQKISNFWFTKISQPFGHKIYGLGFKKPGYLKQHPIPGQSYPTLGASSWHSKKVGHLGAFFELKLWPICQKLVLCGLFLGLFFSDYLLFVYFSIPKTVLIINWQFCAIFFMKIDVFLYINTSFFFPNSMKKAIFGPQLPFQSIFSIQKSTYFCQFQTQSIRGVLSCRIFKFFCWFGFLLKIDCKHFLKDSDRSRPF